MLKFLIDENLCSGAVRQAIGDWQKNNGSNYPLDAICVGFGDAPPTGTTDEELIQYCVRECRILVSLDRRTLGSELKKCVKAGQLVPGIILLHGTLSAGDLSELLAAVSYACEPAEYANQWCWLP